MDRRKFIAGMTAAGVLSLFDARYLAAREEVASEKPSGKPIERRTLGKTGEKLSIIGFGGVILKQATPEQATSWIAEAFERSVNYYDVSPSYGLAQERMGPALKPFRDRCFLACKTDKRDAAGMREELEKSLKLLQTDHFDLYQLHAMRRKEEVEQVFAPGGAYETLQEAKQAGKVRFFGFSAHSHEAAMALIDRKVFDSVMFPFNFNVWWNGGDFGPTVHKQIEAQGIGKIAIKPGVAGMLTPEDRKNRSRPHATWYRPLEQLDQIALGLRFSANLPVDAMLPPGDWDLFKMALGLAQAGAFAPLNETETGVLKQIAAGVDPLFSIATHG